MLTQAKLLAIASLSLLTQSASASPPRNPACRVEPGDLVVNQYQLYPENVDWNPKKCLLAFTAVYNASMVLYDPVQRKSEIVEFPGITHNPTLHGSGIRWLEHTNQVSFVGNTAAAFGANWGADITGDNMLVRYDVDQHKELWRVNITDLAQAKFGGFQDVEYDRRGNSFVIGSFPSSIVRVNADGKGLETWYGPVDGPYSNYGTTGSASTGDILLSFDAFAQKLLRFDMRESKGVPVEVPISLGNTTIGPTDGLRLPKKYKGTVLLIAISEIGIKVLRSKDGLWRSAEYLGVVPETAAGATVTQSLNIGDRLYGLEEFFIPNDDNQSKSIFTLPDITAQVDEILGGWKP